ncbi:sensor histidine kinase [Gryllotalpicola daejeonensis]
MPDSERSALRVWAPVVLSALIQVGTTAGILGARSFQWRAQHGPRFGPAANPLVDAELHPINPAVAVLLVLLAFVGPVLLIWIRRRPGPILIAIAASAVVGEGLMLLAASAIAFYISVIFAVVIAVLHDARLWAWIVTGVLWLTPIGLYLVNRNPASLFLLVPWTIVSIAVLVIPQSARNRRLWREQQLRDAEARRAEEAQAERVRIARELHDVLAHSLSQINVQASVGLHLFETQPEKAATALANVKDTSKHALDEVRQVLGMLRGDAPLAPEQGLAGLGALVDELKAHGLDGTLAVAAGLNAEDVSAATQQAVYRIVQEALTNVTKHAAAHRVEVEVTGDDEWLSVRISDDGVGAAAGASPDGRGLLGMRERAELLGGTLTASPAPGGGFRVEARLPLGGAR